MFTGIIQELGKITKITSKKNQKEFEITSSKVIKDKKIGDSIAINGACMTVTKKTENGFIFTASEESLIKTNLQFLKPQDIVNLEPALRLRDTIDGHLVSGHVDDIAEVIEIEQKEGGDVELFFKHNERLNKFIAEKGSVTVNGVSLTVVKKQKNIFSVNIIPHTLEKTNLQFLEKNAKINLEIDLMARYLINFHENK